MTWCAPPEDLGPPRGGDVHVFLAYLDCAVEVAANSGHWLSVDESERAWRFKFARDRQRFSTTRCLLRGVLGRYLDREPGSIAFAYGPQGKPSLENGASGLEFNVSHSGGLAVFAFSDRPLGVDLEAERPMRDLQAIAERFFSEREVATLRGTDESERTAAFFRCWTRKEAFLKATGEGLSRPLDAFDVAFAAGETPRLLRIVGGPSGPEHWWLEDLAAPRGFVAALAREGPRARLERWNLTP
jgi:4'-phosphopantetheinyl transferase